LVGLTTGRGRCLTVNTRSQLARNIALHSGDAHMCDKTKTHMQHACNKLGRAT